MKLYYVDRYESWHLNLVWNDNGHTVTITDLSAQELLARGDIELIILY